MAERRGSIWLIRHGETEWSATGKHTGRTDVQLTGEGRKQAEALRRHLEGHSFSRVLVSPLARALETCRLAGFADGVEVTPDLREWDYGVFEGRTTAEERRREPGWSVWTHPIDGGESLEQVGERAARVIGSIEGASGDVALFAHAHILRILAATWIGLPPDGGRRLTLGTASLSVLGWERENRAIVCWNQSWHLGVEVNP